MNERITIQHKGHEVRGTIVHRSIRGITVRINQPYAGLKNGLSIPYFAYFGDRDPSYLEEKGDRTARRLLGELYDAGQSIEEHRSELKSAYQQYEKEREEYLAIIGINHFEKKTLRRKFKNDQLTQKQYQRKLKPLQEENKEAKLAIHKLYDKYFDEIIEGNPYRKTVLNHIRNL
ncbi:MAG: hypothetical protein ABEJ65_03165 [bacterium]